MQKFILLCTMLFASSGIYAQRIKPGYVFDHIQHLADDEFLGRATSSPEEIVVARYIARKFRQIGLQPWGNEGYFYTFRYKPGKNPHEPADAVSEDEDYREGSNVIGFLDNEAPYTIVIGAHYDHLGLGHDHNSLDPDPEGKIHNGADDNASGVAGVIELARYFAFNDVNEKYNFLFMAFSGEELGLLGSKKWCENPTLRLDKINYMLNMDMIGRLNDSTKKLLIYGTGTATEWKEAIDKSNQYFSIKEDSAGIGPSDHTSFYLKDIPVLHFFTGQHSDYHRPTDDVEKINVEGEVKVLEMMIDMINILDEKPKLQFFKTRNAESGKMSFKVTMGVMPDYTFDGKGMRIDGVSDYKPAAKAGIQQGDILVEFKGRPVETVQEYMKALSAAKKGERVKVVVLRRGNPVEIMVEL